MPQAEYSALTKAEKRQLPDPMGRDRFIEEVGRPRLTLRYNQVEYKTPKHGPDHNLPVNNKGKSDKIQENALALRDSLLKMPNRSNIIWFEHEQYQGGTPQGSDSVNLYDPDTNLIAVYAKQPDGTYSFLTTCVLRPAEADHLKKSGGNFLTQKMLDQKTAVTEYNPNQDSKNTNNEQ